MTKFFLIIIIIVPFSLLGQIELLLNTDLYEYYQGQEMKITTIIHNYSDNCLNIAYPYIKPSSYAVDGIIYTHQVSHIITPVIIESGEFLTVDTFYHNEIMDFGSHTLNGYLDYYRFDYSVDLLSIKSRSVEIFIMENPNNPANLVNNIGYAYNYPNPFNPNTNITFSLLNNNHIQLNIFNSKGQKVRTLINSKIDAGKHTTPWNGRNSLNKIVM